MAAASDKARFYLEKYVPELQEYERKGIFSPDEISAIARKRSQFEHTVNSRGSTPADYVKYARYEMNVDSLRKKRCKRCGVKDATTFRGQRTIFFILDRATKKFPGDMGLWMQYIEFCKHEKANKKLAKVFTSVLRLRPRQWGLWVSAAKHYAETQGDMNTARSYMQRGLRFCKEERKLWLEYEKLEIGYLAKLAARRKILGLDAKEASSPATRNEEDDNMLILPVVTAGEFDEDAGKGTEEVDTSALQSIATAPAFTGDIPIAIFDASMKQFENNPDVAEDIFDFLASLEPFPASIRVLQHVLDHLVSISPDSPAAAICQARMPLVGVSSQETEFPAALGLCLSLIKKGAERVSHNTQLDLSEKAALCLLPYLRKTDGLDLEVVKVLEISVKRFILKLLRSDGSCLGANSESRARKFSTQLAKSGRIEDCEIVEEMIKGQASIRERPPV